MHGDFFYKGVIGSMDWIDSSSSWINHSGGPNIEDEPPPCPDENMANSGQQTDAAENSENSYEPSPTVNPNVPGSIFNSQGDENNPRPEDQPFSDRRNSSYDRNNRVATSEAGGEQQEPFPKKTVIFIMPNGARKRLCVSGEIPRNYTMQDLLNRATDEPPQRRDDNTANSSQQTDADENSGEPSPTVNPNVHESTLNVQGDEKNARPGDQPFSDRQNSGYDTNNRPSCRGEAPMTLNQSLVSLLECPVCLDLVTPPIYQCCKGHILCQNCHPRLTTCPVCRSRLPGDRSSAMEKVAEKLIYPCKNTVTGCSMTLKLEDKQKHEEGCGFRHYGCIVTSCPWMGYKPELVVHMQSSHPRKLISGTTTGVKIPIRPPETIMAVTYHWILVAHNEVFKVIFNVDFNKRIVKGCVMYIGSPDKADKFSYVFELTQRTHPFRRLLFSCSTLPDTLKPGQPLRFSDDDFEINIDKTRIYRYGDRTIPLHISILPTIENEHPS